MYDNFQLKNGNVTLAGYVAHVENPTHVVCIIHGIGEHAGRFKRVAKAFNEAGFAVVTMDLRGHGMTEGPRGHCAPRKDVLQDIDALIEYAEAKYPGVPLILYGHSMGGNITIDYRARGSKNDVPKGYIISAPWIRLVRPVGGLLLTCVKTISKIAPTMKIKSEVGEENLGNPQYVKPYKADPLVHPYASALCAYEGFSIGTALEKGTNEDNGRARDIPALLMHGDNDVICDIQGSREFAKLQNPETFTFVELKGYSHEIHNGGDKGQTGEDVINMAIDFIKEV